MLILAVASKTEEIVVMTMITILENGMIERAAKAALKGDRWRAEERIAMPTAILTEGATSTLKRVGTVKEMRGEGAVTSTRTKRVDGSLTQNTLS